MKAILTRQSGVTAIVDVYPARRDTPIGVLESAILDTFNSFGGVKPDPFTSVEIIRKQKPDPFTSVEIIRKQKPDPFISVEIIRRQKPLSAK